MLTLPEKNEYIRQQQIFTQEDHQVPYLRFITVNSGERARPQPVFTQVRFSFGAICGLSFSLCWRIFLRVLRFSSLQKIKMAMSH